MDANTAARAAQELDQQGFTIINGFLSPEEVAQAQEAAAGIAPTWEQHAGDPQAYPVPSRLQVSFPDFPAAMQHHIIRPDLLDLVSRVIGTEDLRLGLSFLWFKYASTGFTEQELHSDMANQTITFPRQDGLYRQVLGALYYTDVPEELSPTCVLSTQIDEFKAGSDIYRRRADYPELYEQEVKVAVPAGSLLLYGLNTFHRGGALTAKEGLRISHHFGFRAAIVDWAGWQGWSKEALKSSFGEFLTGASPRQRQLFGFPMPGDPFWNEEALTGVALRYPRMDLAPYREAAGAADV